MLINQKMRSVALVLIFTLMFTVCPIIPTYAQEENDMDINQINALWDADPLYAPDTPANIRAKWNDLSAKAIEVSFEDYIVNELGKTLVTDGSLTYTEELIDLMTIAHNAYVADGKLRVIKFPAGTFPLPLTSVEEAYYINPEDDKAYRFIPAQSGVGFRGGGKNLDGTHKTKLVPAQAIMYNNPTYGAPNNATSTIHKDILIDNLEIDCSQQIVPNGALYKNAGNQWFYKAIYVQNVSSFWMNDIYAHDSRGTLFGIDYIRNHGVYHVDCYAKNSGRGMTGESGPGAGFGVLARQYEIENVKFVNCTADSCKTGGFYLEPRGSITYSKGFSIFNSKAFNCWAGVDDQGVNELRIEDSEFYKNKYFGIRRGAHGRPNGAGHDGRAGSMYAKRTKIYGNGTDTKTIRSAGVAFTAACQPVEATSVNTFEDCEIYNNRGYGIANDSSLPRYLILKGNTKIYSNGGSGIHFRQGTNPAEKVTITTEGDNVEIFNNGICGDPALTSSGKATGAYGDAVTLSANSDNNDMTFKAYGNQGRAVAFRPYMGKMNFAVTGGVYSGDWTGQTNGMPYRNEINAEGNSWNAAMTSFDVSEAYTNYVYNGNANAGGNVALNPNPENAGATVTKEESGTGETYFKVRYTGSGTKETISFSPNTPAGAIPLNTMLMSSVLIKPNKSMTIKPLGSTMSEYKNNDALCNMTLSADEWTRVDIANSCVNNSTAPVFGLEFTNFAAAGDTVILVKNIMCVDKPDVVEYFDGSEDFGNGGTWVNPSAPYNSPSTKNIKNPIPINVFVNAGSDAAITLPDNQVNLQGIVLKDGEPTDELTTTWFGQSDVTFTDAGALDTTAIFSSPGIYSLKLTASAGALSFSDTVVITVTYPVTINDINDTASTMFVDVADTLSAGIKGILAVYGEADELIHVNMSSNIIMPGQTGIQQFDFDNSIQLNEGEILRGFIWAVDENLNLTMTPLTTPYDYKLIIDNETDGEVGGKPIGGVGEIVDIHYTNDAIPFSGNTTFTPVIPDEGNHIYVDFCIVRNNTTTASSFFVQSDNGKRIFTFFFNANNYLQLEATTKHGNEPIADGVSALSFPKEAGVPTYIRVIITNFSSDAAGKGTFLIYQGSSLKELVPLVIGNEGPFETGHAGPMNIGLTKYGGSGSNSPVTNFKVYEVNPK